MHDVDPSIRLEVANDGLLTVDGQCDFSFTNKGQTFSYTVLIASIHEDGLIGLDFLHENDYELSAQKGLKLNGRKCRTFVEKVPLRAVRITTSNKCTIPVNSEAVIPGEAINLRAINSSLAIIYPLENKQPANNVLLGSVLIAPREVQDRSIPIRLLNTSDRNVKLAKNS